MQRISTTFRDEDLFGTGKHGWKSSVPGPVTAGNAEYFNATQEEIARLCELFATLSVGDTRNAMLADIELCRQAACSVGSAVVDSFDAFDISLISAPGDLLAFNNQSPAEAYRWRDVEPSNAPLQHTFAASDTFTDAVAIAGGSVIVGAAGGGTNHQSWTWITSTPTAGTPIAGGSFTSVASDGAGVFAAHSDTLTTTYTSADGLAWSGTTSPAAAGAIISFAGGLFCLSNSVGSTFHTSADGITWSAKTAPVGGFSFKHGATVGGRHYFYGDGARPVWSTTDFTTWVDENVSGLVQQHQTIALIFGTQLTMVTENIGTQVRPIAIPVGATGFFGVGAHRSISSEAAVNGVDIRGSFF